MLSRQSLLIVGLALVAGTTGLFASRWWFDREQSGTTPASQVGSAVGQRRPALTLDDLDGAAQPMAQFDGRPVLVNFWATWCAPCIAELPRLQAAHDRRDDDGITVAAIALDEADAVRAFAAKLELTMPIRLAPMAGDTLKRYGNVQGALPYSVLIGADGTILDARFGELDDDELEALIDTVAQ